MPELVKNFKRTVYMETDACEKLSHIPHSHVNDDGSE